MPDETETEVNAEKIRALADGVRALIASESEAGDDATTPLSDVVALIDSLSGAHERLARAMLPGELGVAMPLGNRAMERTNRALAALADAVAFLAAQVGPQRA